LTQLRQELKVPAEIPPEWLGRTAGGTNKAPKKKQAKQP
jgi:hypothetical protein